MFVLAAETIYVKVVNRQDKPRKQQHPTKMRYKIGSRCPGYVDIGVYFYVFFRSRNAIDYI